MLLALPWGVDTVITNINISFEYTIILIFFVSSLIMAAKSFQLSMITLMVTMAGIFIWFYEKNYNWTLPLTIFFLSLIVLALSIYATDTTSKTGGIG